MKSIVLLGACGALLLFSATIADAAKGVQKPTREQCYELAAQRGFKSGRGSGRGHAAFIYNCMKGKQH
jgi:hypothetical protein